VNGDVRFFGSNLRATHTLAHNIAKAIKAIILAGFRATNCDTHRPTLRSEENIEWCCISQRRARTR